MGRERAFGIGDKIKHDSIEETIVSTLIHHP